MENYPFEGSEEMQKREEADAIRAYDRAKELNEEVIPFEQAINEIERRRET